MVSKTLHLTKQALALGQQYLQQGRDLEALAILGKLARLGSLEPAVAEQTQIHLAEIHLRRRDFAQARRHINVALAYQPAKAEYHHMMAMAVEDDPEADPRRAMQHYRKAVELAPDDSEYRADYGLFLIDSGRPQAGLRQLAAAVELAPDDGQIAQQLALAHAAEGQYEKARRVALHALFRNPEDSRLRRLWHDLSFQESQASQRRYAAKHDKGESLVLLPYPKPARKKPAAVKLDDGTILRLDPPAPAKPPTPSRQKRRQSQ